MKQAKLLVRYWRAASQELAEAVEEQSAKFAKRQLRPVPALHLPSNRLTWRAEVLEGTQPLFLFSRAQGSCRMSTQPWLPCEHGRLAHDAFLEAAVSGGHARHEIRPSLPVTGAIAKNKQRIKQS